MASRSSAKDSQKPGKQNLREELLLTCPRLRKLAQTVKTAALLQTPLLKTKLPLSQRQPHTPISWHLEAHGIWKMKVEATSQNNLIKTLPQTQPTMSPTFLRTRFKTNPPLRPRAFQYPSQKTLNYLKISYSNRFLSRAYMRLSAKFLHPSRASSKQET